MRAVAAWLAGEAAAATAGPAATAPATTVAVIPAPKTAGRHDDHRRPGCRAALRAAPWSLAAACWPRVLLPALPCRPPSDQPPEMTANTSMTPEPGRRFAAVCRDSYRRRLLRPWCRPGRRLDDKLLIGRMSGASRGPPLDRRVQCLIYWALIIVARVARRTLAAGAAAVRPGRAPHEEVFVVLRIVVGLVLTVAAFALAGRRLWWLAEVGRSGQPAPERIEAVRTHPGRDAEVEATEVIGQRKLLKWTVPGAAHAVDLLGLHRLAADDHRGLRRPVLPDVRHPGDRPLGVRRVHRGPVRGRRAGRHHHVRGHPAAQQPGAGRPQVTVRRQPHRRRMAGTRDDLPGDRDAAAVPRRADQHRGVPLRPRRVRLPDRGPLAGARWAPG